MPKDVNGREIKVGDKVRYVGSEATNYPPHRTKNPFFVQNSIYTVKHLGFEYPNGWYIFSFWEESTEGCGEYSTCFELVEPELQTLVDTANAGEAAAKMLYEKYKDQVQIRNTARYFKNDWRLLYFEDMNLLEYRVKPKVSFTPFYVGDNWTVTLSEDQQTINICGHEFKRQGSLKFYEIFEELAFERFGNILVDNYGFSPKRKGLYHAPTGYTILWAEVDRLIEELKKVDA